MIMYRVHVHLSRLRGMTPGDSEAGAVSASVTGVVAVVTGVVAVVVSSKEELINEVLLEAEGEVVTGVWNCCSPSSSSHSPSATHGHKHTHTHTPFRMSYFDNKVRSFIVKCVIYYVRDSHCLTFPPSCSSNTLLTTSL